jgi:hypothetical protein
MKPSRGHRRSGLVNGCRRQLVRTANRIRRKCRAIAEIKFCVIVAAAPSVADCATLQRAANGTG